MSENEISEKNKEGGDERLVPGNGPGRDDGQA